MLTDRPPRNRALLSGFLQSDQLRGLEVPQDDRLRSVARSLEPAMRGETNTAVRDACADFLEIASEFYGTRKPAVRVLAARPLRVREGGWATELFGDYSPQSMLIRVWMRTAVRRQVTSFGTFLSTLCHEFCHHLDFHRFQFRDSWHTRGFYERVAMLYHHARSTPAKKLFWVQAPGERWRIDWPRTNRSI